SNYVSQIETAANVTPAERVSLTVTEAAKVPNRVGSGPVPLMAIVFLGVLGSFAALAFTRQALLDYRAREAGRVPEPRRPVTAQPSVEAAAPPRTTRAAAARTARPAEPAQAQASGAPERGPGSRDRRPNPPWSAGRG